VLKGDVKHQLTNISDSWRPGVYIDADVTTSVHVTAIVRACFAALRQIRSVRCPMTRTTLLTL